MKIDFNRNESNDSGASVPVSATEVSAGEPTVALTKIESGIPTVRNDTFVVGDLIPGFADVILPRLNLVHALGDLKDSFPQGAVVFNQSILLFSPAVVNKATSTIIQSATAPVNITILGFPRPTRYVEKVEGGERGMLVDSEDAVRGVGGTTDYKEAQLKKASGMKYFQPLADMLVAVARPEIVADDDTVFTFPVGPYKYTLGLWACKATAYTAACKSVLFPARRIGVLRDIVENGKVVRGGYPMHSYNLSTRLKKFPNGNETCVPILTPREKSSPEFLEFAKAILNPAG